MSTGKKILTGVAIAAGHTLLESMRAACYRTAMKSEKMQDFKQSKFYKTVGDIVTVCKNVVDTAVGGYIVYKTVFR